MLNDVFNNFVFYFKQAINRYGGEVDNNYSKRCTHLLCLRQQGDIYKKVCSYLHFLSVNIGHYHMLNISSVFRSNRDRFIAFVDFKDVLEFYSLVCPGIK